MVHNEVDFDNHKVELCSSKVDFDNLIDFHNFNNKCNKFIT